MSVADKTNLINKDASSERQILDRTISEEPSIKVKKVELEIEGESEKEDISTGTEDSHVGKSFFLNVFHNYTYLITLQSTGILFFFFFLWLRCAY